MLDALWGEREPGPPGGTPSARGLLPQFTGRRRRPPDSMAIKGASVAWRRTKSGGAEMPGFSQHRSHPRPMYSQKLETRDFRAVPSLEHFSRSHPHRSLVCPDAKGSPYQLPPFITKMHFKIWHPMRSSHLRAVPNKEQLTIRESGIDTDNIVIVKQITN